MRVVVTGSAGLLGWHACARLHAMNCAARFRGAAEPVDLVMLDRTGLNDPVKLAAALTGADAVLHFAGVSRGPDDAVQAGNPAIAGLLVEGIRKLGSAPHVVHSNSVHAGQNTPYGRSKAKAAAILAGIGGRFTDLILPHVFGERARAGFNNVTATLIGHLHCDTPPLLNRDGRIVLLHAGAAAATAIQAILQGRTGRIAPQGKPMSVTGLWNMLSGFHRQYTSGIFPDLRDRFDHDMFNSYRAGLPVNHCRDLPVNSDSRGELFEAVKGGPGGQSFLSWTNPGVTRGDHFHIAKQERFVVLQGRARIRLRRVLGHTVECIDVCGSRPTGIDIPTLHTHSLENTGSERLLTLFWVSEIFDPDTPDTYADPVVRNANAQSHDHFRNPAGDHPSVACHGAA